MPTIIVRLQDIVTDDANPIDLTTLPPDQAVEHIKRIYGFFASSVDVTIRDGIASITLPDSEAERIDQSMRTLERASAAAPQGGAGGRPRTGRRGTRSGVEATRSGGGGVV